MLLTRRRLASWGPPTLASLLLIVHAMRFDFVCDDAFLALRQAQNIAQHGSPVYNLGERVEVSTSPVWALFLSIGLLFRVPPVAVLMGASLLSGALLMFATWELGKRLLPDRPLARGFVLAALAAMAPVAAWSIGGLETPLFAAAVTYAFARLDDVTKHSSPRTATKVGLAVGFACLVRLEALLVLGFAFLVLAAKRTPPKLLLRFAAAAVAPVALLTLFRLAYYGVPLPHTFYAKTAGDPIGRFKLGLGYANFAALEIGYVLCGLLFVGMFLARGSAAVWTARLFVPLYVTYVISVGGDFLDLYRFFVPILPITFTTFTAAVIRIFDRVRAPAWLRIGAGVLALVPHGMRQASLGERALKDSDPARGALGIEPLGWTKRAAAEWSTVGKWIAGVARPGDTFSTGAAGAMPFFSGLPNFDLLGLASPEVARHGRPIGLRPGHTRYATHEQIARNAPTFLAYDARGVFESRGYTRVQVDGEGVSWSILVKDDRVSALLARPDVKRGR